MIVTKMTIVSAYAEPNCALGTLKFSDCVHCFNPDSDPRGQVYYLISVLQWDRVSALGGPRGA